MMKHVKFDVEFNIILSTIKLSSGEELIGHVATPRTLVKGMKDVDFDKFHYVFYPSKVSYLDSEIDNKIDIRLSSWGELFGVNVHPLPKLMCLSVIPASKFAEGIYNNWFSQKYKNQVEPTLKYAMKRYFNMIDTEINTNKPTTLPHVYAQEMFKEMSNTEKSFMYTTILSTFNQSNLQPN